MRCTMKKTIYKVFGLCVAVLLSLFCIAQSVFIKTVYADENTVTYSGVLEDLKKDKSFNEEYYSVNAEDYSLQIIQLAESVNMELFVYVYQPSGKAKDLKASSINVSTTINENISYYNYKLEYLNSSDVFYKYKVVGLTVKDAAVRYYAITSIYRPFDETLGDTQASGENIITETAYAVNKQYCFGKINGKPYVECVDIETIVVTDKFVGFVRYEDGFYLAADKACDSHFVAFNTDKPIENLLEADVYYTTQSYYHSSSLYTDSKTTFGIETYNYAYLKYTDKVNYTGDGLFAGSYKWDRIEMVEDFIANENNDHIYHGAIINVTYGTRLTDSALAELKGKKWVLRFTETSYSYNWDSSGTTAFTQVSSTLVGDVTILRLKFETDGITYNLGVIDNKQTGSDTPSNVTDISIDIGDDLLKRILSIALLAVLIIVILNFCPWVITLFAKAFGIIFKWIWQLICLPFKLLGKLFKKLFHRKE